MPLSPAEWHQRFLQQLRWTANLRQHLFSRTGLGDARRVLEVGCGTGALLAELVSSGGITQCHGLDIQPVYLNLAARNAQNAKLVQGDAHKLPYAHGIFDACICHFLLLWVNNPMAVVEEMARVTHSGGYVLALAEPDYGGRIDFPDKLTQLGNWQEQALRNQGADTRIGRRLSAIFHAAGLLEVETGLLGGQWRETPSPKEQEAEWRVLIDDLQDNIPYEDLLRLRQADSEAWERGERILYVPTFYAWAKVP